MANKVSFWNRHAKGYAKRPVANEEAYQRKLKETQELLKPDMKVLEFGCGTGTTAIHHAKYVDHIDAIDISDAMLDIGRAKAKDAGVSNVTFSQADMENLEGDSTNYDVIMGHSILHLLENKEKTLEKAYDQLKPGGYFISSTACLGGMSSIWKVILPIGYKLGLLPMVKFFTREQLEDSITNSGFKILNSWRPDSKSGVFVIAQKEA